MPAHQPKRETFDTTAMTNVDPKGFVREVETYETTDFGLYLARPADHPQFGYLESWLLPALGLRATIFHFRPGFERDQDRYIDIGQYRADGTVWHSVDLYLDLSVRTGRGLDLLDADELAEALAEGVLDVERGAWAIDRASTAAIGIATHGYDFDAWVASLGIDLHWR